MNGGSPISQKKPTYAGMQWQKVCAEHFANRTNMQNISQLKIELVIFKINIHNAHQKSTEQEI
jgi:hypothetical protein